MRDNTLRPLAEWFFLSGWQSLFVSLPVVRMRRARRPVPPGQRKSEPEPSICYGKPFNLLIFMNKIIFKAVFNRKHRLRSDGRGLVQIEALYQGVSITTVQKLLGTRVYAPRRSAPTGFVIGSVLITSILAWVIAGDSMRIFA